MERTERALVIDDGDLAGLVAVAAAQEAAAIAGGPGPVVWASAGRPEGAARRIEAVERHAAAYGVKAVIQLAASSIVTSSSKSGRSAESSRAPEPAGGAESSGTTTGKRGWPGHEESVRLVDAATVAVEHGCDRIVWPVHDGGGDGRGGPGGASGADLGGGPDERDLDRITRAVDRALLVTRLIGLDAEEHGRPALRIETPYADLTDRQIADLALDLDVAVESCWWWRSEFAGRDLTAESSPLSGQSAAWAQWRRWHTVLRAVGWTPAAVSA